MSQSPHVFVAEHVVAYDYKRSVGPVLGRFFAGLMQRRIYGSRTADGRVLVPPMEADPESGEGLGLDDLVEVGPAGSITSWAWVAEPRAQHPFDRPFAWALIRLDGASSALLHAIDVDDPARLRSGLRVTPRWRAKPEGGIHDIECFIPEGDA